MIEVDGEAKGERSLGDHIDKMAFADRQRRNGLFQRLESMPYRQKTPPLAAAHILIDQGFQWHLPASASDRIS
ncbi:hypothetical protein X755_31170 [Mesorhizobium sp. LNJC405B00]|nr:hypothetical protein X755_31170 [Mesorhizobium sp. LNJC405B00]